VNPRPDEFLMRTIALTVPENKVRRDEAAAHFRERGLFVDWMWCINAELCGLQTTNRYKRDDLPGDGVPIIQKHVGIALSHYMAWTACNLLDDAAVMIIEDDADFPEDWIARLSAALENTPRDVDMLYVGNCCCADKPKELIAGEVFEVKWPFCNQAYIIWKKAIPVLLATQRSITGNMDLALYFDTLPKLRVYSVLPRIVAQRGTPLAP
jgi:hypothetical protein